MPSLEQEHTQEGYYHTTLHDSGEPTASHIMLYGVPITNLNETMRNKLDRLQHQLFKNILGLLNSSAAYEANYILTGLIPLSMQIDQETLLPIGQLINLPHSRYEVRILFHALSKSTPMLRTWESILQKWTPRPPLGLLSKPIPYTAWKSSTTYSST